MVLMLTAGIGFSSCNKGDKEKEPVEDMYIKHPWGTGQDTDWTWKQMSYDYNKDIYYVIDKWGGIGFNINTAADDATAKWFPASDIEGAAGMTVGEYAKFKYNPAQDKAAVEKVN